MRIPDLLNLGAMSRRTFLRDLGASAVGLGLTGCRIDGGSPPDIVVLVLDSLRAKSLPMYGHPRNTAPFLAEFTTRSTLFERCYASATWTRPSVMSILSGLPPQVHGGGSLKVPYPADLPSFPRLLGEAGYRTGFFTANIVIGKTFGMESQFDHVDFGPAEDYDRGPRLTKECEAWLGTVAGEAPALIYIHYHPPHGPYHPPARFVKRARSQPAPGLGHLPHHQRGGAKIALAANILGEIPWFQAKRTLSDDLVDYQQRYEANIAFGDSLAAGFFEMWERTRGHRRTVFFVTGDHGEGLGEHGLLCDHGKLLIDEILHVPLIVHDTARPVAKVVPTPVSHLDLGLTIINLAGLPRHFGLMNENLFEKSSDERLIVSHQVDWKGGECALAMTSGRWRLVYNPGARFGSGHIMEVRSGKSGALTVTGVPLPVPSTATRRPVELPGGATVESFALHNPVITGSPVILFSGTYEPAKDGERLFIRVRVPGGGGALSGPFTAGEFEREVLAPSMTRSERLIVEAALGTDADPAQTDADWRRLLTTPMFTPRPLSKTLEIIGCETEPGAACAGDPVHLILHWRTHRNPSKVVGVLVELIAPDGTVALRETRGFFQHFPGLDVEPRPLLDRGKVAESTFSKAPLDFEDAFWWTLPSSLAGGRYRVRVGLLDFPRLASESKLVRLGPIVPVTALFISGSRSKHLGLHLRHEFGFESLRLPLEWTPAAADNPALRQEARRFPKEGNLDYLLALNASGEKRRELLQACVRKVPFHRRALELLAAGGHEASRRTLDSLSPSTPHNTTFGGVVTLVGSDLCSGAGCIYLTLYWEARATSSLVLAANLMTSHTTSSGETEKKSFPWFIGGEQRPTDEWRQGETVVETIRMAIEPSITEIELKLRLGETWRDIYSGRKVHFSVTSGNGGDMRPVEVDLGSHQLAGLPRCDADFLARKRGDPGQSILIDLMGDPEQIHDRRHDEPAVFERLHRQLRAALALGDTPAANDEGAEVELSEDTKNQLRALGYLD